MESRRIRTKKAPHSKKRNSGGGGSLRFRLLHVIMFLIFFVLCCFVVVRPIQQRVRMPVEAPFCFNLPCGRPEGFLLCALSFFFSSNVPPSFAFFFFFCETRRSNNPVFFFFQPLTPQKTLRSNVLIAAVLALLARCVCDRVPSSEHAQRRRTVWRLVQRRPLWLDRQRAEHTGAVRVSSRHATTAHCRDGPPPATAAAAPAAPTAHNEPAAIAATTATTTGPGRRRGQRDDARRGRWGWRAGRRTAGWQVGGRVCAQAVAVPFFLLFFFAALFYPPINPSLPRPFNRMLNDETVQSIVGWNPAGDGFVVKVVNK